MNKHNFKINYDLRPYLPDIFVKSNIYNSCDEVNNNTNTNINTMVFIINIDRPLNSQYNDPNYMLFGIKNPLAPEDYQFPSLNYFNNINNNINNVLSISPYKVISKVNQLTNESIQILNTIGYDSLNINENEFEYSILLLKEDSVTDKYKILYFYFNLKKYDSDYVNYNNYGTLIYFDNILHNILIYPYYNNKSQEYISYEIENYSNEKQQSNTNVKKSINNVNFDNREIIKYYEKIDYKYFENTNFTMNEKTNVETLKNFTSNIKNYVEYIEKNNQEKEQIINVSLNEISKMFYYSAEYNLNYQNSYTLIYLNNKHINNNISFSNQNNRYSFTMDKKMSNLNKFNEDSKKYSSYYYTTNTFEPTLYQQTINYFLNFYYDIEQVNSITQMNKLNKFLYKIFVYINPRIIDLNYLLINVQTSINPLFEISNNLKFDQDLQKIKLYIIGDIKQTTIYYMNKYKITFEFIDENNTKFTYIIILNIVFYNKLYFNILDTSSTENTPLAYTNCTAIEESISLLPSIYSLYSNNNNLFFYNNLIDYSNSNNMKNYYWNINYSGESISNTSSEVINMYNFYEIIPNMVTNLKTSSNKFYNNVINVLKNKLNNYITNFINIQKNHNLYTHYVNEIKKYINITSLYDETIITDDTGIKYIEYYNYFPKISNEYIDIAKDFIGKYNKVLVYPYDNLNISSFEILQSGKYIKFNFINNSAISYPDVVNEEFVISINKIELMANYYYSLFIMLPLNINQDNEFQHTCDEKFPNPTTYSMGIGGNYTAMYLVLTDKNGYPYRFYSENNQENGLIFGIRLYNYNNFISQNLKLQVIPNLYMNQYMNLNEFIILIENFSDYSDTNNMLWDINKTYHRIHNFNSLNNIILYDYKRFKTNQNINTTMEQYLKFNYKMLDILYENKVQLNYLRYDIKILLYISNLYKIINLTQKLYSYYKVIKINIILGHYDNKYIINLIKYNSGIILNLFEINYNFAITSGNFESKIYSEFSKMNNINYEVSLETINNYESFCLYTIDYAINKIPSIVNLLVSNVQNKNNVYYDMYYQIYYELIIQNINYMLELQVIFDIDNFTNNTSITVFDNIFDGVDIINKHMFLNQINAYLKLIAFNTTKIDELYNLAKIMGDKEINSMLPENLDSKVVKNTYIYNTTQYTNKTNIPRFKIVDFLNDTILLIQKLSIPINNPDYELYQKSISEGILTAITNTIKYFKDIINEIVGIYIFMRNLPGTGIDIYDSTQIGNFYHLLNVFYHNYAIFFEILYGNKIDKFYEYTELKVSFNNLYYSCEEFLLYIILKKDFINDINLFISENVFINEDLYKIIKTDVFCDFSIKTIQNFDNLIINKEPRLTMLYLEKIKTSLSYKSLNFINESTIKIIDELLLKLSNDIYLKISTNNFVKFGSYYIIPYKDLLMFKGSFIWASFNFDQVILDIIKNVNTLNITIFTTYYDNNEITNFYKQALNYTYIQTPYEYIHINSNNNTNL